MHQPIYKRRWVRRAGLLILALLIGYGTYRAVRTDPKLKKVRQLQAEMAQATPEQRREKGREMRDAMQQLSPAQRDQLAAEGRQRFEAELKRYSQLTPKEKAQYLDQRIDQSERMRQQFSQRPQTGAGQGQPGGTGQRGGQNLSDEERDKRRKDRLNQTSPDFRALMDNFRKDMNARRQQRGLKK